MLCFFEKLLGPFCKKENPDSNSKSSQVSKSGKHLCCVCKETKEARDSCIAKNGLDQCKKFVEAHNKCLRDEGFTVED